MSFNYIIFSLIIHVNIIMTLTHLNESGSASGRHNGGHGAGILHASENVPVDAERDGVDGGHAGQRRAHAPIQASNLGYGWCGARHR
jgi:hypothetical protein